MKETLTRKERERQARSDLFLDIAKDIIGKEGFHELSMNRIAEVAEYSKGTIYLHYPSREMVLMALCRRGLTYWMNSSSRVLASELTAFEKLFALNWAHLFYRASFPVEYEALSLVRASSIKEKISDDEHAALGAEMEQIADGFVTVVETAIQRGEVSLPDDIDGRCLGRGLWYVCRRSDTYPAVLATTRELIDSPGRVGDPALILRAILTGLNWQQSLNGRSFQSMLTDLRDSLFAEDLRNLGAAASNG